MKKSFYVLILTGLIMIISGCMPQKGEEINITYEFTEKDLKGLQSINISAPSTNLIVNTVEDEIITVQLHGEFGGNEGEKEKLIKTWMEESTFHTIINPPISKKWMTGELDLIINIPKRNYDEVAIEVTSKQLKMSPFEAKTFQLITTSGTSTIEGFSGEKFSITGTSGDIKLENFSGEGKIEMTSGNLSVRMTEITSPVSIKNTSGKISFFTPLDMKFQLDANIRPNRVKMDPRLKVNLTSKENKIIGKINQPVANDPTIFIRTNSGRLEIKSY
ncbi:DUF4097 family beta strand repeat-containing protein [Bacillus kwashiorkori]|uniref:DUF4097 family beta strand repeat-containing protein n=1 Tax=Bacillus kwashiorkori TaxID=1522318 RepID=UPI000782938A|nr:DUF4097 family beta strand repeat-containing protein [Bacillus kwashiorkori]